MNSSDPIRPSGALSLREPATGCRNAPAGTDDVLVDLSDAAGTECAAPRFRIPRAKMNEMRAPALYPGERRDRRWPRPGGGGRSRRVQRRQVERWLQRLALAFYLLLAAPWGLAQEETHRIVIGSGEALTGDIADLPLTLTSTSEIEGLVAVFDWIGTWGEGFDLLAGSAIADADLIVRRVESDFMVLGVVMNSDGMDSEILEPGTDLDLATARIRCLPGAESEVTTIVSFSADGLGHPSVPDGPRLDNQLTVGGQTIGRTEGLALLPGQFVCLEAADVAFSIGDGVVDPSSGCGSVDVSMANPAAPVEGYVVSIGHPEGLTLDGISLEGTAAEANGADFVQPEIVPGGGTLGVVMDLVAPFEGNVIPPGLENLIARYTYCCDSPPEPPQENQIFDIRFQDGLGTPPKENTAVVGGKSIRPELTDGNLTCVPLEEGEVCDDAVDNDEDGLVDCDDPDCEGDTACTMGNQTVACGDAELGDDGLPLTPQTAAGAAVDVCLFYRSPPDGVQGLSLGVCYPCELQCREGSFDVTSTIVEAVEADFVSHQCDNDPDDGDGCELIVGILVDSKPPFEGGTLPPTESFLRLGCLEFDVAQDEALCGQCLPVEFCDGINGRGIVPVVNLAVVNNQSFRLEKANCEVCVGEPQTFHRGDCNFSQAGNLSVNITDAAATVSFLFLLGPLAFDPPCLDACDCDDNGTVNLSDVMCVLNYLFLFGPFPPAPGPGLDEQGQVLPPGLDPTPDELDCAAAGSCAP